MRRLEWGKFAAQWTDFSGRVISGGSIIIDNNTSNGDAENFNIGADNWRLGTVGTGWSAKSYHTIQLARLRAQLGHTPVILRARWWVWVREFDSSYPSAGTTFGLFRVLPGRVTQSQATYRYRATGVTYEGDGYSPLHGTDVAAAPFAQTLIPRRTVFGYLDHFELRDELLYNLRANTDLFFLCRWLPIGSRYEGAKGATAYWSQEGKRPYLEIIYWRPLEFFATDPVTGAIDLSQVLDPARGADIYLGAVQRGETGSPVKFALRNMSERALPLVTVLRQRPDWTAPIQTTGSGTGSLDYVALADTAVWQAYTVRFSSATAFEVRAIAYRDNPTSLNPTWGTTGWSGSTAADWTAPAGGLTIPATAWQPGTVVNDEFQFFVLGSQQDPSWPADSDDQVQVTRDVGGSPDAAGWRPVVAGYTRSTASVTIDAATVKIPTRAIVPSHWPAGVRAFVGDAGAVHEGAIASVDVAALGTPVFAGTGLNDLARSGNYNGAADTDYVVEIDGTGTPDTFRWSRDGGSSWAASGVAITGSAQRLGEGVHVTFAATTGHTIGDSWTIAATCWGVTLEGLTADSTEYGPGAVVSAGLPVRNLAAGVHTQTTATCGAGVSPPNRVPVRSTAGWTTAATVFLQSVDSPNAAEIGTVSAVGSDYLDLSAALTNVYEAGSVVLRPGVGEVMLHARVVATPATNEEIKRLRVGVRV